MHYSILPPSSCKLLFAASSAILTQTSAFASQVNKAKPADRFALEVTVDFKQMSMSAMLGDLSKRFGISILADGTPVLEKIDINFKGTLRGALDRVADAFDYRGAVSKSGIVFLTKRFNNPRERPQVIPAELHQAASDILKILPNLPTDSSEPPRWVTLLRQLARQLPADLLLAMKQGKKLALSDLPAGLQRPLLEVVQLRAYGDARSVWDLIHRRTDRFDSSTLRMDKKGVFTSTDGVSSALYDVLHEARSVDGTVTKTSLGGFRREAKK